MPNTTFFDCLAKEQNFIIISKVGSTELVDVGYHEYNFMRDGVVSGDVMKAFAIFVSSGLASALGGVRLKSQRNTVPPNKNLVEIWRSFDYSVVPPELVPKIHCDPPNSQNAFVGALKVVLSVVVAVNAAVVLATPLALIVLLLYAILGVMRLGATFGQLWDGTVVYALTLPYTFLTGVFWWMSGSAGHACGRVVLIGAGNETPQCVPPLKYGQMIWQQCPGGQRGQVECVFSDFSMPPYGRYQTRAIGCD